MGYELNISREGETNPITKEEWVDYIKSDPEFEPIEEFSGQIPEGEILTVPTPNAGLWKSSKGEVPFTFSEKYGEIAVKNPERWIIEKMIAIALQLNAVVSGEEGEIYDEEYFQKELDSNSRSDKKWWQFW